MITYSYKKSFFGGLHSPAISTARSGNVIGGGDFALDRIIPDCIRAIKNGEPITIRNPYSTRPYQHVLECLSGYLLLAEKQFKDKESYQGSYNFGPDDSSCISTGDLADLFCEKWGEGAEWENKADLDAPHEANFLKLDCSKSKKILGWKPRWNIETGVEKVIEWNKMLLNGTTADIALEKQICEYFIL